MLETITSKLADTLEGPILQNNVNANLAKSERVLSVATGSFLLLKGVTNMFSHPLIALGEVLIGSSLVRRGVTGFCSVTAYLDSQKPSTYPTPLEQTEVY